MKRVLSWLLISLLVVISFLWGVAYTRYYVFPHALVGWVTSHLQSSDSPLPSDHTVSGAASIGRPSSFDLLQALGYVGTADVAGAEEWGASVVDTTRVQPGLSLFTTGHADSAILIDESGSVVHEWTLPRDSVWWDSPLAQRQQFVGLRAATVLPDLSLLAVYDYLGLVKVDRRSRIVWLLRNGAHHDFWITDDGDIHLLTHDYELRPEIHPEVPTVVDSITVLDPEGQVKDRYSVLDIIQLSPYAFLLPSVNDRRPEYGIDLLHPNSIQVFDGSAAHLEPHLFARGNVLISLRNISTVMIVDPSEGKVLWAWGPSNVTFQHSARLLPTGTILLFDNGNELSSVFEIDPLSRLRTWVYWGTENDRLRSRIYGACQRLENGNTLITDSMQGRALEVTPDKEVVWIFRTPPRPDGQTPVIYGMQRYDRAYFNLKTDD